MTQYPQTRARPAYTLLLYAALLTALVACTAVTPPEPGAQTGTPDTAQVFLRLVDSGGCIIEQITTAPHDQYQVQGASPDGQLLAIAGRMQGANESDTTYEAWEINLMTGEKKDLSHALTNSGSFSPDGRFIVVAQDADNGKTDIFEYERATGELRPVAPHEDWDWLPSYSPDGRFIVFNSYRVDGQSDIHLYEKSTEELTRLTEFAGYDAHAQFSPDGKQIVFHRQRGIRDEGGYIFDLVVYDVESGEETVLTDGDYEESYPAWAPDGLHLVYSSDIAGEHGKYNLYVRAPNGEAVARLTEGDWTDRYAYWTRDGKFIYFNSDRAGASNVYRLPMNGIDCVKEGV